MQLLWEKNSLTAKEISRALSDRIGWNKNTTYTIIKICIEKEYIKRVEPNYQCVPLISKEDVQKDAVSDLVNRLFDGSRNGLFASLLDKSNIKESDIDELKRMINDLSVED